jgi:hypothetical protein
MSFVRSSHARKLQDASLTRAFSTTDESNYSSSAATPAPTAAQRQQHHQQQRTAAIITTEAYQHNTLTTHSLLLPFNGVSDFGRSLESARRMQQQHHHKQLPR